MSKIVIEKGIPLPNAAREPRGQYVGILKQMEVGDSFLATLSDDEKMSTLQSKVRQAAKRCGIQIVASQVGEGQLRVWRLEDKKEEQTGGDA